MKKLLIIAVTLFSFTAMSQEIKVDTKEAKVDFLFTKDNTKGTLSNAKATLNLNLSNLASSKVSGSVDVSTLSTGNKARDKHLKSKDFFDVENYPLMKFESTSLVKEGDTYYAKGKLTIKDVTKDVSFKVTNTANEVLFNTTINAMDYGVSPSKKREKSQVKVTVTVATN